MNSIENDKLNQELGDKLACFREEPPEGMFERIEQTLLAGGFVAGAESPAEEPARVVVPLWRRPLFRSVVASLAAASVCLAVVLYGGRQRAEELKGEQPILAQESPLAQEQELVATLESGEEKPSEEVAVAEQTKVVAARSPRRKAAVEPATVAEVVVAAEAESEVVAVVQEHSEQTAAEKKDNGEGKTTTKKSTRERYAASLAARKNTSRRSGSELDEYWRGVLGEQDEPRGPRPVQVALYTENLGIGRGDVQKSNVSNSQMLVREQSELGGGSFLGPMMAQKERTATLEHSMPVSVGVTVSYSLTDWLSLESGLLFASYSSRGETVGTMSSYVRRRTMGYLGVPLSVKMDVVEFNAITLYGSVGLMGEVCISAKDKIYLDGALNNVTALKEFDRFTTSFNAVVGVDYRLFDNVGLFGEVGCSYWSVPDSYPENYRTIHPLSLTTRVGLSYSFN